MPENNSIGAQFGNLLAAWDKYLEQWHIDRREEGGIYSYTPDNAKYIPVAVFKEFILNNTDIGIGEADLDGIIISGKVIGGYSEILYGIHDAIDGLDAPGKIMFRAMLRTGKFKQDPEDLKKQARSSEKSRRAPALTWNPKSWLAQHMHYANTGARQQDAVAKAQRYIKDMYPTLQKLGGWLKREGLDGHALNYMTANHSAFIKMNFIDAMRKITEGTDLDTAAITPQRVEALIKDLLRAQEMGRLSDEKAEGPPEEPPEAENLADQPGAEPKKSPEIELEPRSEQKKPTKLELVPEPELDKRREEEERRAAEGTPMREPRGEPESEQTPLRRRKGDMRRRKGDSDAPAINPKSGQRLIAWLSLPNTERWNPEAAWPYGKDTYKISKGMWRNAKNGRMAPGVIGQKFLADELFSKFDMAKGLLKKSSAKDVVQMIKIADSLKISDQSRNVWLSLFNSRLEELDRANLGEAAISKSYIFAIVKAAAETGVYGRRKLI